MTANDRAADSAGRGGSYIDDEDDSFSWGRFQHLLYAPLRRPLMVLVPWAAILLLSVAALFVLPKRYRSSTLILIESEKLPDSFVPNIATQNRGRSLDTIRPEILSRTRLERVLDETRPYPDLASKTAAVERLGRATSVNSSGNDGFTIEFVHTDPHKAQEVTERLSTLFIEETMKSREQQVEGAVDFLVAQVSDARRQLEQKDEALRRYKEARMGRLPEQLQTNLATMQMLQQEMRTVEESLLFARERQEALARGLARSPANGGAVTSPKQTDELSDLRARLASLRDRYTDEHPDVESLRKRIARMEARLAAMPSSDSGTTTDLSTVSRDQLDKANLEVKNLEARRADLDSRITALRARVEETPRTEQDLANLKRDYDKLNDNYLALLSKQLDAQMAGRLEQRWKGDRFRILDPASLPEKPYFPKPLLIVGFGAFLGLFAGLGAALVAELADPTIKDPEDLERLLDHPILARIPHMPSLSGSATR